MSKLVSICVWLLGHAGQMGQCPINKDIKVARTKFPYFGEIYDAIIESTGFTPSKVNNLIWSSVRLTTKQKKAATSVRPAPEKKLLSEKDSDRETGTAHQ